MSVQPGHERCADDPCALCIPQDTRSFHRQTEFLLAFNAAPQQAHVRSAPVAVPLEPSWVEPVARYERIKMTVLAVLGALAVYALAGLVVQALQ